MTSGDIAIAAHATRSDLCPMHPEAQVAQIAGSIAEFGFNVPCLVDERPVIRLGHLTGAQARAFRIHGIRGPFADHLVEAALRLSERRASLNWREAINFRL